jgi:hypothetical protein
MGKGERDMICKYWNMVADNEISTLAIGKCTYPLPECVNKLKVRAGYCGGENRYAYNTPVIVCPCYEPKESEDDE